MKTLVTILSLLLCFSLKSLSAAAADRNNDSMVVKAMIRQYFEYFEASDKEKEFYDVSNQLLKFYKDRGNTRSYYEIRGNEALYDISHNHPYCAIRKANKMIEDMKRLGVPYFDMAYTSLGTIFQSRGNHLMAEKYFIQAINAVSANDTRALEGIYSRMASLKMFSNPDQAKQWNSKFKDTCRDLAYNRLTYLSTEGVISFMKQDRKSFNDAYESYRRESDADSTGSSYGKQLFNVLLLAMNKQYERAIEALDSCHNSDIDQLDKFEVKKQIYVMRGDLAKALQVAQEKAVMEDSLNSDLLADNISETIAKESFYETEQLTTKKLERMVIIVIALSVAVITLLVYLLIRRQKARHHLMEKNEQLKTALQMAEESDRMKTEFVRQVSHEVRTPLNAINGFNEVLNESGMTLSHEERQDLVNRIKMNTKAITNIIDEMLSISNQESAEYYVRKDNILCNKMLSELIYSHRNEVSSSIELQYTTSLINRFTLHSNAEAVTNIINHLLENAIKFTSQGVIELHSRLSDDEQMVEISVTDTGRGIEPDKRDKIFEQFFKVDHFQQGIGLGLTVSRKIAQKLGGNLTIDKSYNKGARFILSLPIDHPEQ